MELKECYLKYIHAKDQASKYEFAITKLRNEYAKMITMDSYIKYLYKAKLYGMIIENMKTINKVRQYLIDNAGDPMCDNDIKYRAFRANENIEEYLKLLDEINQ